MQPVFRFAPSPNGHLHLGHAYSALLNAHMARKTGGRLLLRIEDIDTLRCRPEFVAATIEDLDWLGIRFDGAPLRQSDRFPAYRKAAEALLSAGLAYSCFCTRADIARKVANLQPERRDPWPRDPDGALLYPGTCRSLSTGEVQRRLAAGEPAAVRLHVDAALRAWPESLAWFETGRGPAGETGLAPAQPNRWGDFVILRKDTPASYHLAVVIDDACQSVTHVVRGVDLFQATAAHRLLQVLLRLPAPVYHHHDLIRDGSGAKLAKSRVSTPLRRLRSDGISAAQIREQLGFAPDLSRTRRE